MSSSTLYADCPDYGPKTACLLLRYWLREGYNYAWRNYPFLDARTTYELHWFGYEALWKFQAVGYIYVNSKTFGFDYNPSPMMDAGTMSIMLDMFRYDSDPWLNFEAHIQQYVARQRQIPKPGVNMGIWRAAPQPEPQITCEFLADICAWFLKRRAYSDIYGRPGTYLLSNHLCLSPAKIQRNRSSMLNALRRMERLQFRRTVT